MTQVETAARLAAAGVGPTLVPENVIPDGLEGALLRVDPPLGRELTVYALGAAGARVRRPDAGDEVGSAAAGGAARALAMHHRRA